MGAGTSAPSRWTSLVGGSLRLMLSRRIARLSDLERWSCGAGRIQHEQLRMLLTKARDTEYGRGHGFAKILSHERDEEMLRAYRDAVTPADYEAFRPLMARMREGGEADVTWPGVVEDWAETSGTTGGQKYIPVSREMMKSNYRAALDIFAHASRMGVSLSHLFGGRILFLGGSTSVTTNEHGIRTGDLSGLVTPLIRWPLNQVYSPGPEIALMSHWPSKIDAMAELAIDQDLRGLSGMASWSLVLFEKALERARGRDASIRCLRDLWPNLDLFIHGGVKYTPFDRRVRKMWSGTPDGDLPHRLEVYPASEGFIAMQDTKSDPGLRLNTDIGVFYEFIPLDRIDDPCPEAFTCDRVEPGQRYVVCMTTCAGLWRYVIGDVVVFDTIPPDGPPRLRIVGRHRHFINAFGENLIVEEIESAVVSASEATGVTVGEFTASPVYPGDGRSAGLELVVEWTGPESSVGAFGEAFDRALRSKNVDYETKRTDSLGMSSPTISIVPVGTFHEWMASRGRLGGQNKCPRCANHREYVEGVLGIADRVSSHVE